LGITPLDVAILSSPSPANSPQYAFINLHENENTSIVAAKAFIYFFGGYELVCMLTLSYLHV